MCKNKECKVITIDTSDSDYLRKKRVGDLSMRYAPEGSMKDYKRVDWGDECDYLDCPSELEYVNSLHNKFRCSDITTGDICLISLPYMPGDNIFVIERNDLYCGGVEVCEYMFLSVVKESVIASPYIRGLSINETITECMEDTAKNSLSLCCLSVFPAKDCYRTREEADAALKKH